MVLLISRRILTTKAHGDMVGLTHGYGRNVLLINH